MYTWRFDLDPIYMYDNKSLPRVRSHPTYINETKLLVQTRPIHDA
jgi:hypothetical protein